ILTNLIQLWSLTMETTVIRYEHEMYHLYHLLKELGFVCYFSSSEPVFCPDLPVSVFQKHGDYLKQVAGSAATVILNKTIEGWSRVAHESILLGTPVIASSGGGLEELVRLSGGCVCDNP
ncbi:MAG: hypothetical protein EBV15_09090, partial [Bacteroidetes bacterium]|nr:hypothetical protein [Bacteroidota bacterium]